MLLIRNSNFQAFLFLNRAPTPSDSVAMARFKHVVTTVLPGFVKSAIAGTENGDGGAPIAQKTEIQSVGSGAW